MLRRHREPACDLRTFPEPAFHALGVLRSHDQRCVQDPSESASTSIAFTRFDSKVPRSAVRLRRFSLPDDDRVRWRFVRGDDSALHLIRGILPMSLMVAETTQPSPAVAMPSSIVALHRTDRAGRERRDHSDFRVMRRMNLFFGFKFFPRVGTGARSENAGRFTRSIRERRTNG